MTPLADNFALYFVGELDRDIRRFGNFFRRGEKESDRPDRSPA